jgi:tripartite-type tricarboxylate transporter receptor subunit TctC
MPQIDRRTLSVLGLAATLPSQFALAEEVYPSRLIHVIVGFTPGAASDIAARVLGESMGPILGQQVVVENKPGAGSSIAAAYVGHGPTTATRCFLQPCPSSSTRSSIPIRPSM